MGECCGLLQSLCKSSSPDAININKEEEEEDFNFTIEIDSAHQMTATAAPA